MPDKERRITEYDRYIDSIIFVQSPCFFCKRLIDVGKQSGDSDEVFPGSSCEAFPNGIPAMIARGKFNHTQKWNPEDEDELLFEPEPPTVVLDGVEYKVGWKGVPEKLE